jgi:hypothetical protein
MDKYIQSLVCLSFLIGAGCGGDRLSSNSPATNQTAVDNLSALVSAHPELGRAKLSQIKEASHVIKGSVAHQANDSGGDKNAQYENGLPLYLSVKPTEPVAAAPDTNDKATNEPQANDLDPNLAAKAQDLIEEALDKFDFQKDMNALIKVVGITMNEVKEQMKHAQAIEKSFSGAKGDFPGGSKFDVEMKELSCEEIVNNPFTQVPKSVFEQVEAQNREQIKATLAGCPKISAGEFVQCVKDFNETASLVNDYATCEVQSISDLENVIAKATGKSLLKTVGSMENCMKKYFGGCGFTKKEVDLRGQHRGIPDSGERRREEPPVAN